MQKLNVPMLDTGVCSQIDNATRRGIVVARSDCKVELEDLSLWAEDIAMMCALTLTVAAVAAFSKQSFVAVSSFASSSLLC